MPINLNSMPSPGVYIVEDTDGYIPTSIADFGRVYMVGSSSIGAKNTPTQVVSVDDFVNQFGESLSTDYVELYFDNDPRGRLFFVRVDAADDDAVTALEYVETIETAFDEEMPQGFLICPQAFHHLSSASDKLSVATAMRDLCEDEEFQWFAVIDASVGSNTVALVQTEGTSINSSSGHIGFYAPWVVTIKDKTLPPSPVVCGVATRRYRNQGFYQPPAGIKYQLRGVKGLSVYFNRQQQDTLNPLGINLIRRLPDGVIAIWGSRTRSSSEYFRFVNQRITFNVLNRTLRNAFDGLIFDVIDGQGLLFRRIKDTANVVLHRLWQSGALYGAQSQFAYLVVCDETNNPNLDLENGIVRLDVYAVPSPTFERLIGRVVRVPIGTFSVNLNNGVQ